MIGLYESSTCFEQTCAHPQGDSCINITSGIITQPYWSSGNRTATNTEWLYQNLY